MTIQIRYNKQKTIQALRYHFITRPEVKGLLIVVNIFAIASAALFYFHKISPTAFMVGSLLWFILMLVFWFFLPRLVYNKNSTFKEQIGITFFDNDMEITTLRGSADWEYNRFKYFIESPYFFHLYINERSFFLIPKDACHADVSENSLRGLLTLKIGGKKL